MNDPNEIALLVERVCDQIDHTGYWICIWLFMILVNLPSTTKCINKDKKKND